MLQQAAGLSQRALDAIADLERRVVEADGGRLKLEWGQLRHRSGDRVEDLLWWDGDRLLGFVGLYRFGPWLELAGMVAPGARRHGIGTALLDAAQPLFRELGVRQALLIVPGHSGAGRRLAVRHGGVLEHSEHALELSGAPASAPDDGAPDDAAPTLRQATAPDLPVIVRLLQDGFGGPPPENLAERLDSPRERTLVVELAGETVGTLRVTRDGTAAGIYGFVIDPSRQGRGLGRAVLARLCRQLRADGAGRIHLEVAVDNERALGLYTSIGFVPVVTEDYFALPLG